MKFLIAVVGVILGNNSLLANAWRENQGCANFTGEWKQIECKEVNAERPGTQDITIRQTGCERIEYEDFKIAIPGEEQVVEPTLNGLKVVTDLAAEWTSKKQDRLRLTKAAYLGNFYAGTLEQEFSFEQDKLILKLTDDARSKADWKMTCTFEKK